MEKQMENSIRLFGSWSGDSDVHQYENLKPETAEILKFKRAIDEKSLIQRKSGCAEVFNIGNIIYLYRSATNCLPFYYVINNDKIYWSELKTSLPDGKKILIGEGELIKINFKDKKISKNEIDKLPKPKINYDIKIDDAIEVFIDVLLKSVEKAINSLPKKSQNKIAVSQSAGVDSCLILWGLRKLGANAVSITAGTSIDDWDYKHSREVCNHLGADHYLARIDDGLQNLLIESIFCNEVPQDDNLRMGAGNIGIAKKCKSLGISAIFNGHGQDDFLGTTGLDIAAYNKIPESEGNVSERWQQARIKGFYTPGMIKMFNSCFRRYDVNVRFPYYDYSLLETIWSFSESVTPANASKLFAIKVAKKVMPDFGLWSGVKYIRRGYGVGCGLYRNKMLNDEIDEYCLKAHDFFKNFKANRSYLDFCKYHNINY